MICGVRYCDEFLGCSNSFKQTKLRQRRLYLSWAIKFYSLTRSSQTERVRMRMIEGIYAFYLSLCISGATTVFVQLSDRQQNRYHIRKHPTSLRTERSEAARIVWISHGPSVIKCTTVAVEIWLCGRWSLSIWHHLLFLPKSNA